MIKVKQLKNEDRKTYLARVCVAFLEEYAYNCGEIIYDEAECDGHAIADDLKIEFKLN